MEVIIAAISAGASAGLTGVATQAVKDAYTALKAAVLGRVPHAELSLAALEARPSDAKRLALTEDLDGSGAEGDAELLELARALLVVIKRDAPQVALKAGIDLEAFTAKNVIVGEAEGDDVGFRGRNVRLEGDLRIDRARGGGGSSPNR